MATELTKQQRDAIFGKLNAKFDSENIPPCEMCGCENWAIDPYIMELRQFAKGAFMAGAIIPLVSMHCTKCGNSKIFNAIALGAIDDRTGAIAERAGEAVGG